MLQRRIVPRRQARVRSGLDASHLTLTTEPDLGVETRNAPCICSHTRMSSLLLRKQRDQQHLGNSIGLQHQCKVLIVHGDILNEADLVLLSAASRSISSIFNPFWSCSHAIWQANIPNTHAPFSHDPDPSISPNAHTDTYMCTPAHVSSLPHKYHISPRVPNLCTPQTLLSTHMK